MRLRSNKPRQPRRLWGVKPFQKPHSTPKGLKGYDRKRDKHEFRRELSEKSPRRDGRPAKPPAPPAGTLPTA